MGAVSAALPAKRSPGAAGLLTAQSPACPKPYVALAARGPEHPEGSLWFHQLLAPPSKDCSQYMPVRLSPQAGLGSL